MIYRSVACSGREIGRSAIARCSEDLTRFPEVSSRFLVNLQTLLAISFPARNRWPYAGGDGQVLAKRQPRIAARIPISARQRRLGVSRYSLPGKGIFLRRAPRAFWLFWSTFIPKQGGSPPLTNTLV